MNFEDLQIKQLSNCLSTVLLHDSEGGCGDSFVLRAGIV
jgi:hypothetical protein